jgi:hypothetical protein
MAYNITLSNGDALITGGLVDGTIDTTSSSLTLVGKNYPGYGVFLNQNMIRLSENFAKSSAPTSPLPGQLWWDTTAGVKYLKVNTSATKGTASAAWKTIVTTSNGASAPASPVVGEQWWDTINAQLKVWSGSEWKIVGPAATSTTGNSGAIPDTIVATSPAGTYVVLKFYIDNDLVGIWSKEDVPLTTTTTGFTTINPGINLSTSIVQSFAGNATSALALSVGGASIPSSSFLRNDQTGSITGSLTLSGVASDAGLTLGAGGDFNVSIGGDNPDDVVLKNVTTGGNIVLSLKNTVGSQTKFFRGNAVSGLAEAYSTPTSTASSLSFATKGYVDQQLGGGGTGTATFAANIVPSANLTYNLGSTTAWWDNIYGTAVHAKYADLAERFSSDQSYSPGTIVGLGGVKEITVVNEELSEDVFGVISTRAAYLMNSGAGPDATHPPVAVQGRVPVKVIGKIRKGDRLVAAGNGLARSGAKNEITPWNVIGRALEDKTDTGEGTIEAIVKLNS